VTALLISPPIHLLISVGYVRTAYLWFPENQIQEVLARSFFSWLFYGSGEKFQVGTVRHLFTDLWTSTFAIGLSTTSVAPWTQLFDIWGVLSRMMR
jgi:hypothetical protein